jgi:hypothetical protein
MGGTTPVTSIPYPTGTDRVADGDNAIQALAERIEARYPRGIVGWLAKTDSQAGIPDAGANITGLQFNAQMYAGRLYRLEWSGTVFQVTSNGRPQCRILMDGVECANWVEDVVGNNYASFLVSRLIQVTTGSHQITAQASAFSAQTINIVGSVPNPSIIRCEDMGPWPLT